MEEDLIKYFGQAHNLMADTLERLQKELLKIRTGKASPNLVTGLMVDYYGSPTPLGQVANVNAIDSKTITIQPWEKSMLGPIEQAIFAANLGITPQNNGESVLLNIPPMTEERRKDLVKSAKALGEDAKISLRNVRQKVMEKIKVAVKDGYPEDAGKGKEEEIQKKLKGFEQNIIDLLAQKEKDILTV